MKYKSRKNDNETINPIICHSFQRFGIEEMTLL